MYVVIFRARVGELDEEYNATITRMKQLAFDEYGCLEFYALANNDERVALSYWRSHDDILAWKSNLEHAEAQSKGRRKWYQSYSVEVAEISRNYNHAD